MSSTNIPELSVSELSFAIKRTMEESFARVRVRGELSKVKIHTSGHLYSDLKDADSVLSVVCWRGTLGKLSIKPEEGMDVICTGRVTTYPARSNYQLVIEHMELAGAGALLKLLEDRRKKLASEGLFNADRKKPLPFIPRKIGVVTSPTGAVIRDILHRISDRFPCHVVVWPVKVQGDGAAEDITNAINGFNALPTSEKPDVIIVARGGGSLEDLMAFNAENVVRAAAASTIPLISAVGHETDTTLIDYAADLRAPTPTAAAEFCVPERLNLILTVEDFTLRILKAQRRILQDKTKYVHLVAARLVDPMRLLEMKTQRLDHLNDQLRHVMHRKISMAREAFIRISSKLQKPESRIQLLNQHVQNLSRMLETLSYKSTLQRGFAVVRQKSAIVTRQNDIDLAHDMTIEWHDGQINVKQTS